jgi:serine/threonine protein kinase
MTMPVFTLDEDVDDGELYRDFQEKFIISEPVDMNGPSRRRKSSASNRNTPGHRLGTSFEVGIDHSYISSSFKENTYLQVSTHEIASLAKPRPSDFELIKVLGVGSYGKVLLVREKKTGQLFAQKQLKKASIIIQSKTVERTMNEKTILGQVNHPSIVKLFYAFQDDSKLYLILEYLEGGELFQHLQLEKFLSETNAATYLAQMILGLEHLHGIGIVYRDLKPENCLLDRNGYLVLTDFGLSKVGLNDDELCTSLIGTPEYMAPEILQDVPYDYSVDFWSLGCVMFDMLTGAPPFTGNNNKRIMDKILANKLKLPFYLSREGKDLLLRLLKKSPEKRLTDFEKLKKHPFFRKIDWAKIEQRDFEPPIVPVVTDPILAENFDSDFTNLEVTPIGSPIDSPIGAGLLIKGKTQDVNIDNNPFKGFSYTDKSFHHIYS